MKRKILSLVLSFVVQMQLGFAGAQQAGRIPPYPVEQSMKFEFVVNLNAVKQTGVTVAPNGLVRTDRIVK